MAIYHVVLFKLKPNVSDATLSKWKQLVHDMVGQVPGLQKIEAGAPLASTAHRAQGYDMGIIAILDKADDLKTYAVHPAHLKVQDLREEIGGPALAYDLEFTV